MTRSASVKGEASASPSHVLLNLSGGIDSTYCLWRALEAGQDVLVHHIEMRNHEGRLDYEKRAIRRVFAWIDAQRFPGRYQVLRSGFDYGNLRYIVRDLYVWSFLTGVILSNPSHKQRAVIVSSYHLSDPKHPEEVRRRAVVREVAGFEPAWITPLAGRAKADVVREMPRELVDACWWCRRPRRNGDLCGSCRTCRQMGKALA